MEKLVCLEPCQPDIDSSAMKNPSLEFKYLEENVYPDHNGSDVLNTVDSDINKLALEGCNCSSQSKLNNDHKDLCLTEYCSCLKYSKGPIYNSSYCLISSDPYSSSSIFQKECSYFCNCSENFCCNRVVQWGINKSLKVINTPNKGLGVVTNEFIPANTFVCEYTGEVTSTFLDSNEKIPPCSQKDENNSYQHKYILNLYEYFNFKTFSKELEKENLSNGPQNDEKGIETHNCNVLMTRIDASRSGSVARLVNHSCTPNLFMSLIRVTSFIPRACLFALRDIEVGEEISYDYSGHLEKRTENISDMTHKANPHNTQEGKLCYCESDACRKYLPRGY